MVHPCVSAQHGLLRLDESFRMFTPYTMRWEGHTVGVIPTGCNGPDPKPASRFFAQTPAGGPSRRSTMRYELTENLYRTPSL